MLIQLTVVPLGGDIHLSDEIAEVLKIVDDSGLPYQLTPSATCIEGEWKEVMDLVRVCHERVRRNSPHVITTIRIEDDQGSTDKLRQNIKSVEEKAGRKLGRAERRAPA